MPERVREKKLTSLAVENRSLATWAILLHLKAIGIVTTILARDVVALFALYTCHCDLWTDICALLCHV